MAGAKSRAIREEQGITQENKGNKLESYAKKKPVKPKKKPKK